MAERKMIPCVRTESFDVEMGGRIVRQGDVIELPEDEVTGPSARTDFKPVPAEAPAPKTKTRKGED